MQSHDQVRDALTARRNALHRRVQALGSPCETPTQDHWQVVGGGTHHSRGLASLVADSLLELSQIEASLRRIAEHTFDVCILCGSPISEALLRHNPLTATCGACSRGFDADYFRRIRTQHTDLGHFISAVRAGIAGVVAALQSEGDRGDEGEILRAALAILRRELLEHFELEERDGYLGEALQASPHLGGHARRLREEHERFVSEMNAIVSLAKRESTSANSWERIRSRFDRVADDLAVHERAENAVIASAFLDDLGSGD